MAIPDTQTIMQPLLKELSDGKEYTRFELAKKLAKHFNLSEKEITQLLPSGHEAVFKNRVGWASYHLKKAGLTKTKKKGFNSITEEGLKVFKSGKKIDYNFLRKYEKYKE